VWSTQGRYPLITPEIESRLYDYFVAIARSKRCDVLAVGGTENHVHLLITFPATVMLCDLMRELKAGSSRWLHATLKPDEWFDWQNNYAAIAVSPSHRKRIIAYIHNRKQHHADGTTIGLLELDCETYESDDDDSSEGRAAEGA
jgi:REP element-mobilizing transposase RayT